MIRKQSQAFDSIVLGFLLFQLGEIAESSFEAKLLGVLIKLVAWFFIYRGYTSTRGSMNHNGIESSYLKIVRFYMFLCVIMIIRGYFIDYQYQWDNTASMINHHLFKNWYILPYLMPLVLNIPIENYKFDKYIKYAAIFSIVSLVLIAFNFSKILTNSMLSAQGFVVEGARDTGDYTYYSVFGFAVLCFAYISKREWLVQFIGMASVVAVQMIGAHRGGVALSGLLIMVAVYANSKYKNSSKIWTYLIVAAFATAGVYVAFRLHLVDLLLERGLEDNRSHVDDALLEQMTPFELIFGKGLNGRYFFDMGVLDQRFNGWRYGTETGFYNLVLKGGYLMAFVYCIILLVPAYKGIFKSNNMLCKVGGFYIFHSFLALYPFGWLLFDIHFLIIWMLIAICMSPKYRSMGDNEIRQIFFRKQ